MYWVEGSCAPAAPLMGGPPGRPGRPWPAVPNDLPIDELREDPGSTEGVTREGVAPGMGVMSVDEGIEAEGGLVACD